MPTVYIDIDSLRPDHVGAYGYDAPTTPTVDELAADAVRFDRSYAANSPCCRRARCSRPADTGSATA